MSRKASPTLIGAFVVGAALLLVAGAVVFGSGRFFRKAHPFVCFFESSVNGLTVGAPVKFKGVEIGAVTSIRLRLDQVDREAHIPVIIELDERKIEKTGVTADFADPGMMQRAIGRGLRARLETESLVTGVLYISLDYHPESEAHMVAKTELYPEIPTLPTRFEQAQSAIKEFFTKVQDIDVRHLVDEVTEAARAVGDVARSKDLREAIAELERTLASVRELSHRVDGAVVPLADSLRLTAERTSVVGSELETTLRSVRAVIEPDSPLVVRLQQTLDEVSQAARIVSAAADYLARNPSAVVVGRDTEQEDKRRMQK